MRRTNNTPHSYFGGNSAICHNCREKKPGRYITNEGDRLHQRWLCNKCIETTKPIPLTNLEDNLVMKY